MAVTLVKIDSSCRNILWVLVFCGFAVNYMLRANLNLAIVAMVLPRENRMSTSRCINADQLSPRNVPLLKRSSILSNSLENFHSNSSLNKYDWSEYDQNIALGAYYWIHWLTQLPGGLLARRYGTKLVFGWGNLATAMLGLLIPALTHVHLYGLVALRVLQGFVSGIIWPSMHNMTAKWIPPNERGKFVSAYLGSSIGAALTYPLCALCIDWFGWEAAFYSSSSVGIIWYIFWHFLVFDDPELHPRISNAEREYIIENIGRLENEKNQDTRSDVPWKEILTSRPLWITTIAHWGGVWGFLTFMTEAPTYFTNVHHWNINATGILSGLPHLLRMAFSYFFGIMTDWLLKKKKLSLTNVRKLATFLTTGVQGLLTLGLGLSGCKPTFAIFFMMTGTAVNGAVSAGTLANLVDLSPNYASVLLGFAGLVTASAGFLSPVIVGILTNHNQSTEQWRLVFMIAAINLGLSGVVYTFWGTSKEQRWNDSFEKSPDATSSVELRKLDETSTITINEVVITNSDTTDRSVRHFECFLIFIFLFLFGPSTVAGILTDRIIETYRYNRSTMAKGSDWISCRDVLWYMVFSGCAINYMFKINLNLVLVATVLTKKTRTTVGQCALLNNLTLVSNVTSAPETVSTTIIPDELEQHGHRFHWNEYEQGLIIGAFYWLYWASQVPGGVLGRRYGAKKIFGGGNLVAAIICLLLPFVMKFHIIALIILRCIQGFTMGVMYPSIHGLPGKWVPSSERSKFVTAYLGGSMGTAITYPLCAMIIYYINWEAAFYVSSLLGIIWFVLWCYLVYDTPHKHPRISVEELEYIAKNTAPPIAQEKKRPVPWCSILTSGPLWITITAHWGATWGFHTLLAQTPSYFNYIHGWSLNMTGILSGAPHLALMGFAYLVATVGDYLLRTKKMSLRAVRKIATILSTGCQAVMLIGLSFSGCTPSLAVAFMILGTAMSGAMSTGTIANLVDLSPNYAGVLLGITGLVTNAAAFLSPMIVGLLTNNNQTTEQWQLVFLIAAGNLMAGCIVYVLCGTSEEQPWNHQPFGDTEISQELEKLKPIPKSTENVKKEKGNEKLPEAGNVKKK
ncbi:uncharacterized protein [Venturia canescens]|uniref:uncharacterized protein n=1 Tax=Venturia canescens TaxID=32260 RepID=UPI001C9C4EA1|nr:uncharacterized protein LOC122409691 [Venturia canescens]